MPLNPASRARLHLLLARPEDGRPALDSGLPAEASFQAPRPERLPRRVGTPSFERLDADPNDLPAQRWALVAPEGEPGDSLLRAVAPLRELRERQQGAPARIYRVPPDMDARQAVAWRDSVWRAEDVPPEERPRYLLLLGDAHLLSLELQHVLAQSGFVGRLGFSLPSGEPDAASCSAYAAKVLASEARADGPEAPDVLLFTARDGTQATDLGYWLLVDPCRQAVEQRWLPKRLARGLLSLPGAEAHPDALPRAAAEARACVLLSVAHGLGAPQGGWDSPKAQRTRQGNLCLAPGRTLSADEVRSSPFLPEGLWFSLACFGAATPPRSHFHPWLELLARNGAHSGPPQAVLQHLPRGGERPFLAALPQAALANPQGPLAVIGHSDLAWMYAFSEPDNPYQSRASRFLACLEAMARGSRAGVALDVLMHAYRDVNDALMADYQLRQEALEDGLEDPVEPASHGHRWMLRNDLRGYLLLGDPAVRLPLQRAAGRCSGASGAAGGTRR